MWESVTMPSPGRLLDSRLSVTSVSAYKRVAVEQRLGKGDLAEAEIADDGALRQLRHRQADQRRQREHRVDQPLVERRQRVGERRIEVQRLGVHRQRGEQARCRPR